MAESSVREPTIRFYRCKRCNKLRRGRGLPVHVPFVYFPNRRKAVSYYAPYCRQCFDLHREELNQETRKEEEGQDPFRFFDR